QSNSRSAGAVRGVPFPLPTPAPAKLITVPPGRILDVAVDVRRAPPTYGKDVFAEPSAESSRKPYILVGFSPGLLTLTDDALVMYKVSEYYAPAHDSGIRFDDPDISFPWPMSKDRIIISDKDGRLPYLREFDSPFIYDGHPLGPLAAE